MIFQSHHKICRGCIGEIALAEAVAMCSNAKCSYCNRERECAQIQDIAEIMLAKTFAIGKSITRRRRNHFDLATTEIEVVLKDMYKYQPNRSSVDFGEVSNLVLNAGRMPKKARRDVRSLLDTQESRFFKEIWDEENFLGDPDYWSRWGEFVLSISSTQSFFNRKGHDLLSDIFRDLESRTSHENKSILRRIDPAKESYSLFRARMFEKRDEAYDAWIRPDIALGPPQANQTIPGRMNALGVSVFYGSTDEETAVCEVRPQAGMRVAVVRFDLIRPVTLLDIQSLQSMPPSCSIFHEGFVDELELASFLKHLGKQIAKPVISRSMEKEYFPTQALCEFLEKHKQPEIDGIVFPSIQNTGQGLNVVLFNKSARVEPKSYPENEYVLPNREMYDAIISRQRFGKLLPMEPYKLRNQFSPSGTPDSDASDNRAPTLRVDSESFKLQIVDEIRFSKREIPPYIFQFRHLRQ